MNESAFRVLLLRFALFPLVTLCAFVGVISLQIHQITEQRAESSRATNIILACDALLNGLVDQETGVRGYAAGGDALFLDPYRGAEGRLDRELTSLATAVDADPGFPARVASIRTGFEQFEGINRQIVTTVAAGHSATPLFFQQKQVMDVLRGQLGQIIAEEMSVRASGRVRLSQLFSTLPVIAIAGGLLVAVLLSLDGIRLFRRISRAFRAQINEVEVQRNALHTTLQSIGDAVIVCDAEGQITLFNPTAAAVSGWSEYEAIGEDLDKVFNIINEYSRESVESPVDKVLRTGHVVGLANHTLLIRQDGSEVAIDDSGAPVRGDGDEIVGVVLVFRDIQARRKAERELALRNAELESLLSNAPAGFASFDRSYRFVRVNKSLSQIDGIPESGHLGKSLAEVLPNSGGTFSGIIDQVFKDGNLVHREFTGRASHDPDFERQWLTWFYPVFTEESTEPILVGAIVLDTTERWHAQEALVRTEKLVAVGRLAASIAHEMNNPLTSVTNLLYLIACDQTLNESTRGFVDRANVELDRVSKIATQTLRFARRTVAPTQVSLEEIVNGIVLLFSGRLKENQIVINVRKRRGNTFHGYSSEVMQLLTNLVSNAIDAIGNSGKITIAIQNACDWRTNTPCVAVSVADSGSGIPENYRDKIWEPFFTTKADTGTGLGLFLVDETVRKNGGFIRMRTSAGPERHGTIFRLLLPLQMPVEQSSETAAQPVPVQ
jgi:PAS domain S-box-containing protein